MPLARNEIVLGERRRQRLVSKLDTRHLDDQSLELRRRHPRARLLHEAAHLIAGGRESLAGSRIGSTLDHGGNAGCKRQAIEGRRAPTETSTTTRRDRVRRAG
jgi:hypothetical protein